MYICMYFFFCAVSARSVRRVLIAVAGLRASVAVREVIHRVVFCHIQLEGPHLSCFHVFFQFVAADGDEHGYDLFSDGVVRQEVSHDRERQDFFSVHVGENVGADVCACECDQ